MSEKRFKKISVVGLGYIGLPTAAMFASRKIEVVGVDINQRTVDTINRGEIHIIEPDLDMIVQAAVKDGYLRATTEVESAEAFLIAVPTPFKGENHEPDLTYIHAATLAIAPVLEPGNLVILESTAPVGATEQMTDWLAGARPDLSFPYSKEAESDIRIAHCPERVLPGKVMQELITNDRVIGGMTPACSGIAANLYKVFVTGECVIASGPRVAEMAKLTENSYRDVNIAFANELSIISDKLGLDVWELIKLANRHPRVEILQPGPGVGGHCIAVDPWFIVSSAQKEAKLIRTARTVNDSKPHWVLAKVLEAIHGFLEQKPTILETDIEVSIYGLTFKPDIDDLRESPALYIAEKLASLVECRFKIIEPNITELPNRLHDMKLVSLDEGIVSDIHLLLVDHSEFKAGPIPDGLVVDCRGVWK